MNIAIHKESRFRLAGNVARTGAEEDAYRVLVGELERNMPLGRPRHKLEDNIKIYLEETG